MRKAKKGKKNDEKLRKSPKKESGIAYTLTPTQIAIVFMMRQNQRTWKEVAEVLKYSEVHFHRLREASGLDDSLESIKQAMKSHVDNALFLRATGMPRMKRVRKVKEIPSGQLDEKGEPKYIAVEKTDQEFKSYLAGDVSAMQLWYERNQEPEIELIPNFIPVSEFPKLSGNDTENN